MEFNNENSKITIKKHKLRYTDAQIGGKTIQSRISINSTLNSSRKHGHL